MHEAVLVRAFQEVQETDLVAVVQGLRQVAAAAAASRPRRSGWTPGSGSTGCVDAAATRCGVERKLDLRELRSRAAVPRQLGWRYPAGQNLAARMLYPCWWIAR